MLAMLLACATGVGEIDLAYAEAEGRRLIESAKAAQAAVKAKEKAARAKVKAAKDTGKEADLGEDNAQSFLQLTCKSAFKVRPTPPETLLLTTSTLMPPPPPKYRPPPTPRMPPPPVPRPPPVTVPSEDARWLECARMLLDHKQTELELKEQQLECRERQLRGGLSLPAELMRVNKRQVREEVLLMNEIRSLEKETAELDTTSGCKRLRDERDELRKELSREQSLSAHWAAVCERLRGERDDARDQLATAHADVDELLEWKASTCLEAQRRLMCPRL